MLLSTATCYAINTHFQRHQTDDTQQKRLRLRNLQVRTSNRDGN